MKHAWTEQLEALIAHVPDRERRAKDSASTWIERAETAVDLYDAVVEADDEVEPEEQGDAAIEVLAAWMGLRRVRLELDPEAPYALERISRCVQTHRQRLVEHAPLALDPEGWMDALRGFDAYLQDLDADPLEIRTIVEAETACALTRDLDDAELVAAGLEALQSPHPPLAAALGQCSALVVENPARWVPAASSMEATLASLRPDLPVDGAELLPSTAKFFTVLCQHLRENTAPATPND